MVCFNSLPNYNDKPQVDYDFGWATVVVVHTLYNYKDVLLTMQKWT